ncbi:MAG: DUF4199 domain-containing protein [Pseudomonadota bacterium]
MKKYIWIYGAISGLITISSMVLGIWAADAEDAAGGEVAGYLIMLVALSLIFVAIKQYRDKDQGGVISFGQAFLLGVGVSAVAGVAYVIVWEIYLYASDYAFINDYAAAMLEEAKTAGISAAQLADKEAEIAAMKASYARPLYRLPMTFVEIFPVGVIVSLVSAAILRKHTVLPA